MRSAVVALATEESTTRGLATALANGLCAAGPTGTLLWVSDRADRQIEPPPVAPGVDVVIINTIDPGRGWIPDFSLLHLSRQIAPRLREFDVVYGLTTGHPMMHAVRESRFSRAGSPYFVAVVDHLPDAHCDLGLGASAIARRFGEKYVLAHCDLVIEVAAGCRLLATLGEGPPASHDIGRLQSLRDVAESGARAAARGRTERAAGLQRATNSLLTIFVSHSGHPDNTARILQSLDLQTYPDFSVIVVDISSSIRSAAALAELAKHYGGRGWIFRREPQSGEARGIALSAALASSKYLMFMDANDAPEPRLIERALDAAEWSGDDLLEIWSSEVADHDVSLKTQNNRTSPQMTAIRASYGLDFVDAMHGNGSRNPLFIVRRTTFDAVGGYPQGIIAGSERQALAVRIAMAGYCTDVLPEILNTRYVTRESTTLDDIQTGSSLRWAFDERLKTINMQSFAIAFQSVAQQLREVDRLVETRQRELRQRFATPAARDRLRLLMLVSAFPYPPRSGCLLRWWSMIRFLCQRHDIILATFCTDEQSRQRHYLLNCCRSIYAADTGGPEIPGSEEMPSLVRARMRVTMRDALRAIPSALYDVALIEQIFLAPFLAEINAPTILGEHHIESQLLSQGAQTYPRGPLTERSSDPLREAELMRDYENRTWPRFAVRSAVKAQERDEIQGRAKTGETILVENGANPDLWISNARSDTDRVAFFGMLNCYPYIDSVRYFWRDIWPHISRRRPSAALIVAGCGASAELRNLAREPGFILVEDPQDIRAIAASASVSVVPARVDGSTHQEILNSMALGLPVVTTSLGCAGLTVKDGEHLLVRNHATDFAAAVDELLGNARLWRKLRQNGRAAVAERYSWNKVLAPLETALWNLAR